MMNTENLNKKTTGHRNIWLDSAKGFSIILVIYSHNNSFLNEYIYTFHVHLFFFISGIFYNNKRSFFESIKKKFKSLIIPYYIWAVLLYIFWFLIIRGYGGGERLNYSPIKNLIGVFTAQGGRTYMDWGIPLWFVPCLFIVNFLHTFIFKIPYLILRYTVLISLPIIGFLIKDLFNWYFWSFNIALVVISFYALGHYLKSFLTNKSKYDYHILIISGIIHFLIFNLCGEINIYRSNYGNNILLFIINGVAACVFYIQMFKCLPNIKFLSFLGKNTLSILAMHLTALLFIKLILSVFFKIDLSEVTEFEKVVLTLFQTCLLYTSPSPRDRQKSRMPSSA